MNVLCARTVCAGLGGDAASVLADSNQMQGVLHSYSSPQFDIQEITTENGIRVREFVNRCWACTSLSIIKLEWRKRRRGCTGLYGSRCRIW